MTRATPLVVVVAALLLVVTPSGAALKFDSTSASAEAENGSADVRVEFPFTNAGEKAVTIRRVESSCNCTVPSLEKDTFEPGERGVIRAVYAPPAGVFGLDQKMLKVETDDPDQALVILRLSVYVHPPVEVKPGAVYWANAAEASEKVVTVKVRGDKPADALTATADAPGFDVTVTPVVDGREYKVTVRPTSTTEVRSTTVRLEAQGIGPLPHPPQFSAGVMAPGIAPPAEVP